MKPNECDAVDGVKWLWLLCIQTSIKSLIILDHRGARAENGLSLYFMDNAAHEAALLCCCAQTKAECNNMDWHTNDDLLSGAWLWSYSQQDLSINISDVWKLHPIWCRDSVITASEIFLNCIPASEDKGVVMTCSNWILNNESQISEMQGQCLGLDGGYHPSL